MGLFTTSKIEKQLKDMGFTCGRTLFKAPTLSLLPEIYIDDTQQRIAVRIPPADPKIFNVSAIVAAELVEDKPSCSDDASFAKAVLYHPSDAIKLNAQKRNMCTGLGITLALRLNETDKIATLTIPMLTQPIKRSTTMYSKLVAGATALRDELRALGGIS